MASTSLFFPHSSSPTRPLLRAWLPVALFAIIFAIESTANFGTDHTSAPLHAAWRFLFGPDPDMGWSETHHILRKIGHFSGYGILSLLCFRAFWLTFRNTASRLQRSLASHGLAIAATFCVASADEIHQTFLPNRTGLFSDVLLDTAGATALQLFLLLLLSAIFLLRRPAPSDPWQSELSRPLWSPRSFKHTLQSLRRKRTRPARVRRATTLRA